MGDKRVHNELTKIKGGDGGSFYFSLDSRRQWTGIKAKHRARVIVLRADKIHEDPGNTGGYFLLRRQFMRNPPGVLVTPRYKYNGRWYFSRASARALGRKTQSGRTALGGPSRHQVTSIMKSKIAIDSYHCPTFPPILRGSSPGANVAAQC